MDARFFRHRLFFKKSNRTLFSDKWCTTSGDTPRLRSSHSGVHELVMFVTFQPVGNMPNRAVATLLSDSFLKIDTIQLTTWHSEGAEMNAYSTKLVFVKRNCNQNKLAKTLFLLNRYWLELCCLSSQRSVSFPFCQFQDSPESREMARSGPEPLLHDYQLTTEQRPYPLEQPVQNRSTGRGNLIKAGYRMCISCRIFLEQCCLTELYCNYVGVMPFSSSHIKKNKSGKNVHFSTTYAKIGTL